MCVCVCVCVCMCVGGSFFLLCGHSLYIFCIADVLECLWLFSAHCDTPPTHRATVNGELCHYDWYFVMTMSL